MTSTNKTHTAELLKNCKAISKFIAVKYKHIIPEIYMAIKNREKPMMNLTAISEDTSIRVEILIGESKYKESNRREIT